MATTTTASIRGVIGQRANRRKFTLKLGGNIMAMRGNRKKKKNKRGNRR